MAKKTAFGRHLKLQGMSINPSNVASFETFETESATKQNKNTGEYLPAHGIRMFGTFSTHNPVEFIYETSDKSEKAQFDSDVAMLDDFFHSPLE